jgi:hypothetical protein
MYLRVVKNCGGGNTGRFADDFHRRDKRTSERVKLTYGRHENIPTVHRGSQHGGVGSAGNTSAECVVRALKSIPGRDLATRCGHPAIEPI